MHKLAVNALNDAIELKDTGNIDDYQLRIDGGKPRLFFKIDGKWFFYCIANHNRMHPHAAKKYMHRMITKERAKNGSKPSRNRDEDDASSRAVIVRQPQVAEVRLSAR